MINFDLESHCKKQCEIFPNIFRCLIIGPSSCGKTNLLLNLLINKETKSFDYNKIYIYSKTLQQSKYQLLINFFRELERDLNTQILTCFENENEIILPEECDSTYKTIFIFDDVLLDKQNIIEKYFAQGRNNNVSCFYLCQSYTRIPKQIIRDNSNMLILFNTDERNLKHIYSNHVFHIIPTFDSFKTLCLRMWNNTAHKCIFFNKESSQFYSC
jgi:GTPase SAR1 family protein